MNRTKVFGYSKCFLANRDNFCPYEQILNLMLYHSTGNIRVEKKTPLNILVSAERFGILGLILTEKVCWNLF
jgi:hypothetical protein